MERIVPTTASRITVRRSPELTVVTIVIGPAGGSEQWSRIFAFLVPLVGLLALVASLTRRIIAHGLSMQHPGPTLVVTLLAGVALMGVVSMSILDALWKRFGSERIVVDNGGLSLVRVLGPVRRRREFRLSEVSNIRWRERRVMTKGSSYNRRVLSFDVASRTVDLGTQLSFVEATELERELRRAVEVSSAP